MISYRLVSSTQILEQQGLSLMYSSIRAYKFQKKNEIKRKNLQLFKERMRVLGTGALACTASGNSMPSSSLKHCLWQPCTRAAPPATPASAACLNIRAPPRPAGSWWFTRGGLPAAAVYRRWRLQPRSRACASSHAAGSVWPPPLLGFVEHGRCASGCILCRCGAASYAVCLHQFLFFSCVAQSVLFLSSTWACPVREYKGLYGVSIVAVYGLVLNKMAYVEVLES